jgi:8-oxo-dGTP pyrophosphatase MutT (NUDIX family)
MTTPVLAAGIIARSPQGRVLLMRRVDDGTWAWPGGGIKEGETADKAAWREFYEETGYRLGDVGKFLMRRTKDDGNGPVDFTTFIADVEAEFTPRLNHEHSAYMWADPTDLLKDAA